MNRKSQEQIAARVTGEQGQEVSTPERFRTGVGRNLTDHSSCEPEPNSRRSEGIYSAHGSVHSAIEVDVGDGVLDGTRCFKEFIQRSRGG